MLQLKNTPRQKKADSMVNEQLMEAILDSNESRVKLLLKNYGADVNYQNTFGQTPVIFSAKINSLKLFTYLLEQGADVFHEDKMGQNALHWAEHNGNDEIKNLIHDLQGKRPSL